MDQFLSWLWEGAKIVVIALFILRAIPVAFDAWKSGNLIVGAVKTIGPVISLAAILYGGWVVVREASDFIQQDAGNSSLFQDAQEWTGAASGALDSGSDASSNGFKEYVNGFKEGLAGDGNSSTDATTGEETGSETTAGDTSNVSSGNVGNSGGYDLLAPTAVPAARSNGVQPVAQPTKVVAVHAAPMQTENLVQQADIDAQARRNAELGVQARATAEATGNMESLNGNSESMMFGTGGGGPAALEADQTVTAIDGGTYTVQRGDDLTKISRKVYGSPDHARTICKANNLPNCNAIAVGKKLTIPSISN